MDVKRTIKIDTKRFITNDIIEFDLKTGERIEAMAVKQTNEGMIFVSVNCLAKEYQMFKNAEILSSDKLTYENSSLRLLLNNEILNCFPDKIKTHMLPINEYGDLLRIPTECEIFGENINGIPDTKEQWVCMNELRNRIAFSGDGKAREWYWLMNRCKRDSETTDFNDYFTVVEEYGHSLFLPAAGPGGVRLVFLMKN